MARLRVRARWGSKVNESSKQNENDPVIVRAAQHARVAVISIPVPSRTSWAPSRANENNNN